MSWLVIKFVDEDSIEVVPSTWYIKASNECFWPVTHNKQKIWQCLRNRASPDSDWKIYRAQILGEYGDLSKAQKKAKIAEETDNLDSSQNEAHGLAKRVQKRNRRYYSSGSDIASSSSSDYNTYPPCSFDGTATDSTPILDKSTDNSFRTMREGNNSSNCGNSKDYPANRETDVTEIRVSNPAIKLSKNTNINTEAVQYINDQDFKQTVIQELTVLNLKINALSDSFHDIIKILRNVGEPLNVNSGTTAQSVLILQLLPLKDNGDLNKLESMLNESNNQSMLIQELGRIGGHSIKEIVRKCLYKTLSNNLGMKYTWEGKNNKFCFKKLKLSSVIFAAVRKCFPEATESEITMFIKLWLVRAKDRNNHMRISEDQRRNTLEEVEDVVENPQTNTPL